MKKNNHILIFAKPPIPGKTKSRLAKVIGKIPAAELSEALLIDIIEEISRISNISISLFYPPEFSQNDYAFLSIYNINFIPQKGSCLGDRIQNAFHLLFNSFSANKIIIIGGDCINITTDLISLTLGELNCNSIIIQPAEDGGFTLIGQNKYLPNIYKNIKWGSHSVLNSLTSNLLKLDFSFKLLAKSFDIDTIEDLTKLQSSPNFYRMIHTKKVFEKIKHYTASVTDTIP